MKARLKGISSIDLPGGAPELPADPTNCWIVVQADIGAADGDAADEFTFYVCTPAKLMSVFEQEEYVFGKHLLIVPRFDWQVVEMAISTICEQVDGETWEELAEELHVYGGWEFHRYADDDSG